MTGAIRRFFEIDYILPKKSRQGEVPCTKDMYSSYLKVAWPAMMQGLFLQLMTAIDLVMVGALGAGALAAVGIMSQPKMILLIFVRAIAVAVIALVSRRWGEGRHSEMNAVLKQGLLLTLLIYMPLLALSWAFLPEILSFAGAQAEFLEDAVAYGGHIVISLLFAAFSQIVGAALIGTGNTRVIFTIHAAGNVVNTGLNFLLIYGIAFFPRMGVAGAGMSTLISSVMTTVLIFGVVIGKHKELTLSGSEPWRFGRESLRWITALSGSSLGEQSCERFGMFVYTKMVASLGVTALATHHVSMNLCDIFYSFSIGLSQASASWTGQNLGKKRPDLAEAYGRVGARVGLVMAAAACLLYIVARYPLIRIYTQDAAVVELGAMIIILMAAASFPQALQLVYSGVLKGAGDNFYVMKYSLIVIAIFRPILTYLLCFVLSLGLYGAWIALVCDQSLRMLCAGVRFRSGIWKRRSL